LTNTPDHIATIRVAIEYMKGDSRNLRIQLDSRGYDRVGTDIDAALQWLDTIAAGQEWTPLPDGIMPNWDHAPNWANYWTRDESGHGMWWETEPYYSKEYAIWMNEKGKRTHATSKPTLRARDATGEPTL
jgi:hypothetical protein